MERISARWCYYLRGEKTQGNLINVCKCLIEGSKKNGTRLFSAVPCDVTRSDGPKLKHWKFHLSIRKNSLCGPDQTVEQVSPDTGFFVEMLQTYWTRL